MTAVRVLVLRAPGINCEVETAHVFARHGAQPDLVHVRRLAADPALLDRYRILAVPGGFAYGDDVAAGRLLAHELRVHLADRILQLIDRGGLVIGICNGFQALVKMGLLPRTRGGAPVQEASVVHNDSDHYECRWVRLRCEDSRCVFLEKGMILEVPAAHGEGKFTPASPELHRLLADEGYVALRYVDAPWSPTRGSPAPGSPAPGAARGRYPANPNGSVDDVAGLTDVSGRVLGLMPHPDRAFLPHHMPRWTREGGKAAGDGDAIFATMVRVARAEG